MQNVHTELQSLLVHTSEAQKALWAALSQAHLSSAHAMSVREMLSSASRIRAMHDRTIGLLLRCHHALSNRGLENLPFDVLSYIFKTTCSSPARGSHAITISHVCRRFRQIALNTAVLWSRLYSQDPIPKTAAFLSRTKEADLAVVIEEDPDSPNYPAHLEAFMALVIPHCSRWAEFRYLPAYFSEDEMDCFSILGDLKNLTAGLRLPRLRDLYIYAGPSEYRTFKLDQGPTICGDWWTPALKRLTCWNGQPDCWLFKSITTLTLKCEGFAYSNVKPCFPSLLEALAALPHLEILEVIFLRLTCEKRAFPVTELYHLKTLHLTATELGDNETLRKFSSALRLPSLLKLSLMISVLSGFSGFPSALECVFFKPMQCPSLQDVHFERDGILHNSGPRLSISLDPFFQAFPNARNIFINLIDLSASYTVARTPDYLETFSIICHEIEVSDLERLIKGIKLAPGYAGFHGLVISGVDARPPISLDECEGLIQMIDGKLVFDREAAMRPLWAEDFARRYIEDMD
ncbi:hypothetical protein ACEPAF_8335 [Sanghuangporus sanghuang]